MMDYGRWRDQYRESLGSIDVRRDSDGTLDEVVAKGVNVHLERMSDGHVWLSIECDGERFDVNLFAEGVLRKRIRMRGERE